MLKRIVLVVVFAALVAFALVIPPSEPSASPLLSYNHFPLRVSSK